MKVLIFDTNGNFKFQQLVSNFKQVDFSLLKEGSYLVRTYKEHQLLDSYSLVIKENRSYETTLLK